MILLEDGNMVGKTEGVPSKYSAGNSELIVEVKSGGSPYNIELTSD